MVWESTVLPNQLPTSTESGQSMFPAPGDFLIGSRVKIVTGELAGLYGAVTRRLGAARLELVLDYLSDGVRIQLETKGVEKAG